MWQRVLIFLWGVGFCLLPHGSYADNIQNGFDLSNHAVPLHEIRKGGPQKDGIPAIHTPYFIPAQEATFLRPQDRVLGLVHEKESRAYPLKILNWHEVVNDVIQGRPIMITYCPLCGTGIGFERNLGGTTYEFGVSGLLYQSDMLMYDQQTQSLWSQLAMEAVAGPLAGTRLRHIFLEHTTWETWRNAHPHTQVLSTETGFHRDYNLDPYLGYAERMDLMFPVNHTNDRLHPKEWVIGVEIDGVAKAYPFSELEKGLAPIKDQLNTTEVIIEFDPSARTAGVHAPNQSPIPSVTAYWFAWYAFHPDTLIFQHP